MKRAETGVTMESVTIQCVECGDYLTLPIQDIPEEGSLSDIAADFLAGHRECPISIQVRQP